MSLSNIEINRYLNGYPVDLQDIFLEVRSLIIGALPDTREDIASGGVIYYYPHKKHGGKWSRTGICYIVICEEFVEVGFPSRISRRDTAGLLAENKKGKPVAHFEAYDQVPWEELDSFIQAGIEITANSIV